MTTKAQRASAGAAPAPTHANGDGVASALAEAIQYEQRIADEASALWDSEGWAFSGKLDRAKLAELRALLRRPIPRGFIEHVGVVTGKPYESSGIRSVQVQMDRLDNVLGPDGWGYQAKFSEDGKLCHVRAWVGYQAQPLYERDSYGGVKQGSSLGNVYKGSFTNAAKLAFARLGPGWEVYVGAADFDPDTDKAAAEAQAGAGEPTKRKLPEEKVAPLAAAVEKAGLSEHLDTKLRGFGAKKLEDLTVEQAVSLYEWTQGGGKDG